MKHSAFAITAPMFAALSGAAFQLDSAEIERLELQLTSSREAKAHHR